MGLVVTGFDSIIGTDFNSQLPSELKVINQSNASIVEGNKSGKAIRLNNGAYLQFHSADKFRGYAIYVGFSFKTEDSNSGQRLANISAGASYPGPYQNASYLHPEISISESQLKLRKSMSEVVPLFHIKSGVHYFIEIRHQFPDVLLNEAFSEIWVNGILVSKIRLDRKVINGNYVSIYIGDSYLPKSLDIDDLYINCVFQQSGGQYFSSVMPILASAKVKNVNTISTKTNTFSLTGAASVETALSDVNDDSYISSQSQANAVLNLDTDVDEMYSANLVVRSKSDSNSVLNTVVLDSSGTEISGSKQSLSLSNEIKTYHSYLSKDAYSSKQITEKLKSGATITLSSR